MDSLATAYSFLYPRGNTDTCVCRQKRDMERGGGQAARSDGLLACFQRERYTAQTRVSCVWSGDVRCQQSQCYCCSVEAVVE